MNLNIKVKSYEAALADEAAKKIVEASKKDGANISGPVPLPTKKEIFTILRSVHINKKSREQFEMRTHKRLIILKDVSEKLMESLKRMEIPAGVNVEVITK